MSTSNSWGSARGRTQQEEKETDFYWRKGKHMIHISERLVMEYKWAPIVWNPTMLQEWEWSTKHKAGSPSYDPEILSPLGLQRQEHSHAKPLCYSPSMVEMLQICIRMKHEKELKVSGGTEIMEQYVQEYKTKLYELRVQDELDILKLAWNGDADNVWGNIRVAHTMVDIAIHNTKALLSHLDLDSILRKVSLIRVKQTSFKDTDIHNKWRWQAKTHLLKGFYWDPGSMGNIVLIWTALQDAKFRSQKDHYYDVSAVAQIVIMEAIAKAKECNDYISNRCFLIQSGYMEDTDTVPREDKDCEGKPHAATGQPEDEDDEGKPHAAKKRKMEECQCPCGEYDCEGCGYE